MKLSVLITIGLKKVIFANQTNQARSLRNQGHFFNGASLKGSLFYQ